LIKTARSLVSETNYCYIMLGMNIEHKSYIFSVFNYSFSTLQPGLGGLTQRPLNSVTFLYFLHLFSGTTLNSVCNELVSITYITHFSLPLPCLEPTRYSFTYILASLFKRRSNRFYFSTCPL